MNLLTSVFDFLIVDDPRAPRDLIFVLAGRPERKSYGLELLHQGLAPRLVLSVGRFEVRQTAAALHDSGELLALRDQTSPQERHFWIDLADGKKTISRANVSRSGTFEELEALAGYLASQPTVRIAFISTSIHLRRVHLCCSRIPFFAAKDICFWAVPEESDSVRRQGWWVNLGSWRYLISEYFKLAAYHLIYR